MESAEHAAAMFSLKDHMSAAEEVRNFVTTTTVGRNGNSKILRYDVKRLVRFSAVLTSLSKGTVFTMDSTSVCNVLFVCVIAAGVCWFALHYYGGDPHFLSAAHVGSIEALALQINAFVPFCLALYVSLTLTRWWALRINALGRVFDAFADISMLVACELHEKKWTNVRMQVAKYGFASIELLVQAAREQEDMRSLRKLDLLTPEEIDIIMQKKVLWQRPMVIWAWIMRVCMSAMDHHLSPQPRTSAVMAQCLSARRGLATINTYLDTQLPFAYVHLITLLVNIQNLVFAAKTGLMFAVAIVHNDGFMMVQQGMSCIIVCFIYQALLQISYVILDPFGDDVLDFPIKAYMNYIASTVDAMFEAQAECPVVASDGTIHRPRPKRLGKKANITSGESW
eukprot:CAMPEP_0168380066 /NCGR_PEP_ID=MMETSP0228-20121227/12167_1 /TAXON_ID=133427 /ORGANISM="Protoceratium reticulatum, Strain CCCM 535 (=CCMP 1889)" /LENGTH=395 /DNA_ID=CAMNT_0008393117 /DNA_START=24 /DNA_END=1208 /DNA_ORIENTATION=-